jgi:hypothetical protein
VFVCTNPWRIVFIGSAREKPFTTEHTENTEKIEDLHDAAGPPIE